MKCALCDEEAAVQVSDGHNLRVLCVKHAEKLEKIHHD